MTTKRYRYIGKERDDESGFYYMGARYYCPWLARWLAPDPINNEWYNQCKGVPQRNRERDFMELTCSSYEYCYANPMRFIDPNGEQATPEQNASSQHPVGYQNELTTQYEFSYKWGGNVTRATDESNGREYSILKQQYGGKEHYFSWVNNETGEADEFTGGANNKTSDGKWNGIWKEYLPSETVRSQAGIAAADAIGKGFVGLTMAAVAAPLVIEAAGTQAGAMALRWTSQNFIKMQWQTSGASAVADVGAQLLTNNGDISQINIASTASNFFIGNPFVSASLGSTINISAQSISGKIPIISNPITDTTTQKAILINTIGNFGGNKLGAMMKEIPVFPMMSKWGEAAGQTITNIPANLLTQTPKSK